jgi:hypothetical protein
MKQNLFLIATTLMLTLLITVSSCKKDKEAEDNTEKLPPETQTGAFTFGYKVDGVIYKASGKGGLLSNQFMYYNYLADSTFNISSGSAVDKKFNIDLTFKCTSLNSPCYMRIYPFKAIFQDNSNGTIPGNSNVYTTNDTYFGSAIIKYFNGTIYPGNSGNIVSGTFDLNLINANGKVIHITEGRFDIGR